MGESNIIWFMNFNNLHLGVSEDGDNLYIKKGSEGSAKKMITDREIKLNSEQKWIAYSVAISAVISAISGAVLCFIELGR